MILFVQLKDSGRFDPRILFSSLTSSSITDVEVIKRRGVLVTRELKRSVIINLHIFISILFILLKDVVFLCEIKN